METDWYQLTCVVPENGC